MQHGRRRDGAPAPKSQTSDPLPDLRPGGPCPGGGPGARRCVHRRGARRGCPQATGRVRAITAARRPSGETGRGRTPLRSPFPLPATERTRHGLDPPSPHRPGHAGLARLRRRAYRPSPSAAHPSRSPTCRTRSGPTRSTSTPTSRSPCFYGLDLVDPPAPTVFPVPAGLGAMLACAALARAQARRAAEQAAAAAAPQWRDHTPARVLVTAEATWCQSTAPGRPTPTTA